MAKRTIGEKMLMGLVNGFMRAALHSPLHRVASKSVLVITFNGRRSGRTISTPISYLREGDTVRMFTGASWRRNLKGGALVRLWIQGKEYSGWAEVCEDDRQEVAAGLAHFLSHVTSDARFYGVSLDENKVPNPAEISTAAQRVAMITVRLSKKGLSSN